VPDTLCDAVLIRSAIVVGAGGTGSHLLEPLARTLVCHRNGVSHEPQGLVVVDGDAYDVSNRGRQLSATPGASKALVHVARLRAAFPDDELDAIAVPRYLDRYSARDLLASVKGSSTRSLLVVLAVDNHATRRDVLLAIQDHGCRNVLVLSPGNNENLDGADESHGNVLAYARVDGVDLTPHPLSLNPDGKPIHPELAHPGDRIPGGGCAAAVASGTQRASANAFAAAACLALVERWLRDEPLPDQLAFETGGKERPLRMRASPDTLDLKRVAAGRLPRA
jgi:hypothetical protein